MAAAPSQGGRAAQGIHLHAGKKALMLFYLCFEDALITNFWWLQVSCPAWRISGCPRVVQPSPRQHPSGAAEPAAAGALCRARRLKGMDRDTCPRGAQRCSPKGDMVTSAGAARCLSVVSGTSGSGTRMSPGPGNRAGGNGRPEPLCSPWGRRTAGAG